MYSCCRSCHSFLVILAFVYQKKFLVFGIPSVQCRFCFLSLPRICIEYCIVIHCVQMKEGEEEEEEEEEGCCCCCLLGNLNRPLRPPYRVPEIFHDSTVKKRKGNVWWSELWREFAWVGKGACTFSHDKIWCTTSQSIRTFPRWFHATSQLVRRLLIPKTIGNWKRDCAWGCARGINTTWENLQIEKHKSVRWAERTPPDLCFSIWRFSQVVLIPRAQPHAQSLFSISNCNSFWY